MNTKRTRLSPPSAPVLDTLADVDRTLLRLGEIERDLEAISAHTEESIALAREEAKTMAAPLAEEKALLERALTDYGSVHRAEFGSERTRDLTHGAVGFRLSSRVVIRRVGDTLAALKSLGLASCIRTTETPNKEAMRQLDVATLASVGAYIKTDDTFWYELKREELAEVAQ